MTLDMEKGAFDYFDKLDAMGGMVKAIETRLPAKRNCRSVSTNTSARWKRGKKSLSAANEFTIDEKPMETLYIDETVGEQQTAKLKALRSRRDNAEVTRRLDALKRAAAQEPVVPNDGKISQANTMPYIIDCVRAYATVGEICQALKEVYGTYEEVSIT